MNLCCKNEPAAFGIIRTIPFCLHKVLDAGRNLVDSLLKALKNFLQRRPINVKTAGRQFGQQKHLVEKAGEQEEYEAQVARLSELYTEQKQIAAELEAAQAALNEARETGSGNVLTLQNNIHALTEAQEANAEEIAALEEASREYGERQAEAAVLMGSTFRTTAVQVAIEQFLPDTPIFMMNGFIALPNVYGVLSDERWGIADCVAMLGRKGKRSIAFFVDQPTPSSALKTEGFIRGMAALGREESGLWIYRDVEGSQNGGYETAKRLLAEHPEVDGLICSQDIIACGAMRAIQNSGRSIPADVAVIGVDNSSYAEICTPRLTSLDNMIFDSCVTIAHKLVDVLNGDSTNQRTMLLTNIVEREST